MTPDESASRRLAPDEDRMVPARDRSRIDPIRLAGEPVFSLDSGCCAIDPPAPEPDFHRVADWRAWADSASLTSIERRALAAIRRGVPRYKIGAALGISQLRGVRLFDSLCAKLCAARPTFDFEPVHDSLRLAFRDRLPSGARPWSLGILDENFASVMREENYLSLISQRDPATSEKPRRYSGAIGRSLFMGQNDSELEQQLRAAEKRLPDLLQHSEECERKTRSLRIALATAEASEKTEREEALIDARAEDRKFRAAVEALDRKLSEAEASSETAAGAVQRIRDGIAQLRAEIAGRRKARCLESALPIFGDIRKLLVEMRERAIAFSVACDNELSVFDVLQTAPGDPRIGYDLAIIRSINDQIGLVAHGYKDWRELLGIRAA
jgi:hypothetical protein